MARSLGQSARLLVPGLLALVVLAPLAVLSPTVAALSLAALGGAVAWLARARAAALAARCDKLSTEFGVLSERLLRLEALAGAEKLRADTARAAGAEALSAGVEEVTVEIGLLSGIVRDLAAVVAAQDGEIARLKEAPPPEPAAPVPQSLAAPAAPPPPEPSPPAPRPVLPEMPASPRPIPPRRPDPAAFDALDEEPRGRRGDGGEAAMVAAFDGAGLEVHLQPIVTLPQRKVSSYEASARLRVEGVLLAPETFVPVLERHGRTTDLDRRMLQRVATIARHLAGRGSEAAVSYGLSPLSLFEPGFLRSLARIVAEPALAGRLVLALPQESWRSLDAEQASALAALRGRVGFTLDRPTDLRFDALSLAERGVGQVKVPAELLLRAAAGRRGLSDIAVEDLVAALARSGIRLVADRVEREADVPDLIDLDVPFAQGGVFAGPRAVRAEVLATPAPAPVPPEPEQEPEPPAPRRNFRDFLRRAG
ncbi:EAL domain-containing protein [Methylobacterium sp. sgz302541]|uniref:EAL domain-containing protein n=1 Tax=unclassified Methylobacterium TaxID=2615210 RepID=UPI003D34E8D9